MKILIFLFMIILNFQHQAYSQALKIKHKISQPPLCFNNKGEKVLFQNLNSKRGKITAGVAKKDVNGLPIIYRFNYQKSPNSLQLFIDYHECAHHQTGDLDKRPPPQNSIQYMIKENIADCVASILMKSDKINGEILIKETLLELKKAMRVIGFPKTIIESRELNIKQCFKKNISLKSYINYILKKRGLK